MKKLIIVRGIQGSGKSTYAREWVLQDPEHRVRFNNDDIRNMLGKYWVPNREDLVSSIKQAFLKNAFTYGYDIVVDNMNLNPRECEYLENEVRIWNAFVDDPQIVKSDMVRYNYEIEYIDFKTPLEECIRRDALRENPIGESVITATYNRYKKFYEE